jgi:hypothetical protein
LKRSADEICAGINCQPELEDSGCSVAQSSSFFNEEVRQYLCQQRQSPQKKFG